MSVNERDQELQRRSFVVSPQTTNLHFNQQIEIVKTKFDSRARSERRAGEQLGESREAQSSRDREARGRSTVRDPRGEQA
ncbi:hypothetical protein Syun_013231 [Stephania yunnanensis]|uniref:Uncharacterized protein n=1 Tax=Stephania yunnanensis TaxID=152371 RepID=A0AAP0PK75_9MAGN